MEYIGSRISVLEKEDELSIIVLNGATKQKNTSLLLWIIAWLFCGSVVLWQFFEIDDRQSKLTLMVWLSFWAYFAYVIIKAYRWRVAGKEVIKIKEGKLFIKRDQKGKGKIAIYLLDHVQDLRIVKVKKSFLNFLNDSYWLISGERLLFDYYGKTIKFGIQLEQKDASALLKRMKRYISQLN